MDAIEQFNNKSKFVKIQSNPLVLETEYIWISWFSIGTVSIEETEAFIIELTEAKNLLQQIK